MSEVYFIKYKGEGVPSEGLITTVQPEGKGEEKNVGSLFH